MRLRQGIPRLDRRGSALSIVYDGQPRQLPVIWKLT